MPKARRRMLPHRLHGAEGGAGVRGSLPAAGRTGGIFHP